MPRISEETIQRVAEANDIVEVIGSYFPLKRAGANWMALCPFHREKTPSFNVNPQRQTFHCFGCHAGGTVFRFLMDYEHIDFVEAVRRLASRAGIPIIEEAGAAEDDRRHAQRRRLLALHAAAAAWFHQNLLKSPQAQRAREYLKGRGISSEVARSWQLGYAPDSWDALIVFAREKGFSAEEISRSGLASSKDDQAQPDTASPQSHTYARFRDRVMFPIRNDYGEVIAFSGRVLDPGAKTAKYVNSPETPLFVKGRVLYGLDKSKRALIDAGTAIVCEGQLDLISAFEAGVQNVIAPQGTAFTPDQARLLRRFVDTVVLCFDSDTAGQEAVSRSLPALLECGLDVRVARLPQGEDPDSLIRTAGPDAFRSAVAEARNFFDHALLVLSEANALETPQQKARAARRLGPFVALIKEPVLRETTARKIASRLGTSDAAFAAHLKAPQPTPENDPAPEARPSLELSEGIRHLCRLSLCSAEARAWLAAQNDPPVTAFGAGGDLLKKILHSPQPLEEPTVRAAFLAQLPATEELALARLDLEFPQGNALAVAQNNWIGLALVVRRGEMDAANISLRTPGLPAAERTALFQRIANIRKQILDLQGHLNDL